MPILKFPYNGKVYVSSPYGYRMLNGQKVWHSGIDLVGRENKNIYAPCDGIIGNSTIITDKSNKTWEWGNFVRLDTNDGYNIFMCHMSVRFCNPGQKVKQGDLIGLEGNTGYSFGSHCHFEVRKNGQTVNPMTMFKDFTQIYAGLTYENKTESEEEDMTKEEVLDIIKEYENNKKKQSCPEWAKEELNEAIDMGITDGTRPIEDCPRYQVAIMVKRGMRKIIDEMYRKTIGKE